MSTATSTLTSTQQRDHDLNQRVLAGDILGAFEEFYADDVVMQENSTDPFAGKDVNRDREKAFVESLAEVHKVELLGSAVNGDRTYSEWVLDVTFKNGTRYAMAQVAVRQWKGGQVVHERFYYKG